VKFKDSEIQDIQYCCGNKPMPRPSKSAS